MQRTSRIEDYALIGDCETAALVSRSGSIDWLCWPRFDSGACCAALLGGPENGHWVVAPVGATGVKRHYQRDTLILETEYTTQDGTAALIDFMPMRVLDSHVIRLVVGQNGRVTMRTELRCAAGAACAGAFMRKCVGAVSAAHAVLSCVPTARRTWMRVCCCYRCSDSCGRTIHAYAARSRLSRVG